MHLPYFLRRVNRVFTNRLLGPLAHYVPPLAIVHHVGRKSGKSYQTPVVAFPGTSGFVIPMTYGRDVDWGRNLVAAGGGVVEQLGRRHDLHNPRIVGIGEAFDLLPPVIRNAMRLANFPGYVLLDHTGPKPTH